MLWLGKCQTEVHNDYESEYEVLISSICHPSHGLCKAICKGGFCPETKRANRLFGAAQRAVDITRAGGCETNFRLARRDFAQLFQQVEQVGFLPGANIVCL